MQKQKKKFYQKKWFIAICIILVLGIIGSNGSGDSSKDAKKTETSSSKEKETKKETPVEVVYNIGDTVTIGDLLYTIDGKEIAKSVGGEYVSTDAAGQFVILNVTVKNVGNKERILSSSDFKIKQGDKEFKYSTEASFYLSGESLSFEAINPDSTISGRIAFDVSDEVAGSDDLQLMIKNDKKQLIDL